MPQEFETIQDNFGSFVEFIKNHIPATFENGFDIRSFINETFTQDEIVEQLKDDYNSCKEENQMLKGRINELIKENYKLLRENYKLKDKGSMEDTKEEMAVKKQKTEKSFGEPYILLDENSHMLTKKNMNSPDQTNLDLILILFYWVLYIS